MTRVAIVSFALTMLTAASGCERKPTNAPEAPVAKTDFAPDEEEEHELAGPSGSGEEEDAPGLNAG